MPRRVALLVAVAALATASSLHAAGGADPLLGTWRATGGGTGTLSIQGTSSLFKLVVGKGGLSLGCIDAAQGDVIGFVELPSRTKLPPGHYDANFGHPGEGCSYSTALVLSGNRFTATVTLSENDVAGGPFTFTRVGAAPKTQSFRWTSGTKTIVGRGTGAATSAGKVLSAGGTIAIRTGSYRWSATVDAPGTIKRGPAFRAVLTVNVTSGSCDDKIGQLVLTKGHAVVRGICNVPEIAGSGTTTLR